MNAAALWCQTAWAQLQTGAYAAARATAEAGLRTDSTYAGLWEILGLSCYELEDYASALHALETATTYGPLTLHAQLALAELYTQRGFMETAEAIYSFLAEHPACPPGLMPGIASGLGRCGKYAAALAVCQRLTDVRPEHHAAWFGIAFYQIKLGAAPSEAIPALCVAQRLAPHALTYRLSLASLHAENKDYTAAYELLQTVPAEVVRCPLMVNRCIQVFAHVGDVASVREYEHWFARMTELPEDR